MDFIPENEILFHRSHIANDSYFIRIDGIGLRDDEVKSWVYFGKMTKEYIYIASANKRNKTINIYLPKEWLDNYFMPESTSDFFRKNIFHNEVPYHYEFLDSEYKRLINEMLIDKETGFTNFIIQNRIELILERFFSRYYRKFSEKNLFVKATEEQLERLEVAEKLLIKDLTGTPLTIARLSKISALSTTKLKSLFKEIYGLPVYQYFQKHRMQKAKAMLLSKKYSVRETATELGYINLKDFVKAFKKVFDQLPEEIAVKK